ncbi:MAG TPA: hypothetical protein VFJ95_10820, partial [Gammaproteobacteria bacterium]|nr:hypothetical protein [Gammaproteobacteria bacterium]
MSKRGVLSIAVLAALAGCDRDGSQPPAPSSTAAAPQAAAPTAPAAPERIVYSSLRPGNWDIFYFAKGAKTPRRLTDHPGLDYDAVLSPD